MKLTATLNTQEIKEAIAKAYGVQVKDVSLLYNNFGNHTAIVEGIDMPKSDLKGDTGAENAEDELKYLKERLAALLKELAEEVTEDCGNNCEGCKNKNCDMDDLMYTAGVLNTVETIAMEMGIIKMIAEELGIEVLE